MPLWRRRHRGQARHQQRAHTQAQGLQSGGVGGWGGQGERGTGAWEGRVCVRREGGRRIPADRLTGFRSTPGGGASAPTLRQLASAGGSHARTASAARRRRIAAAPRQRRHASGVPLTWMAVPSWLAAVTVSSAVVKCWCTWGCRAGRRARREAQGGGRCQGAAVRYGTGWQQRQGSGWGWWGTAPHPTPPPPPERCSLSLRSWDEAGMKLRGSHQDQVGRQVGQRRQHLTGHPRTALVLQYSAVQKTAVQHHAAAEKDGFG